MRYATTPELIEAAKGLWIDIFKNVSPALEEAVEAFEGGSGHVPCPVHGGSDGFRLLPNADHTGVGICNTCGTHAGIALIAWAECIDFLEAKDLVADQLGLLPSGSPVPKVQARPKPQPRPVTTYASEGDRQRRLLNQTWANAQSLDEGVPVVLARYLEGRGLSKKILNPKVFRFAPSMPFFDDKGRQAGNFPALLAMMESLDGKAITLHRTYLDDRAGSAPVALAKKMMSYGKDNSLSGASVHLTRPGKVLSVGEGIETMLSVFMATRMPTWAATTATLLSRMEIPDETEEVWIWADKDVSRAGEIHARKLCERLWAEGKRARIILPKAEILDGKKSMDWNDVLRASGTAGFPGVENRVKLQKIA